MSVREGVMSGNTWESVLLLVFWWQTILSLETLPVEEASHCLPPSAWVPWGVSRQHSPCSICPAPSGTPSPSISASLQSRACAFLYSGYGKGFQSDHVPGWSSLVSGSSGEPDMLQSLPNQNLWFTLLELWHLLQRWNPSAQKSRIQIRPDAFPQCSTVPCKGDGSPRLQKGGQVSAWAQPLACTKNCPNQMRMFQVKLNI